LADRPIPSLRVSRLRFALSLAIIIFIFATRFVYSVIVVARDDFALELAPKTWQNEILICAAMALWEIVPTSVILFLFWEIRSIVPPPPVAAYVRGIEIQDPVDPLLSNNPTATPSGFVSSRIFSNPHRYDSDDEGGPRTPSMGTGFLHSNSPRVGSLGTNSSGFKTTFSPYSTDSPLNRESAQREIPASAPPKVRTQPAMRGSINQ